MIAWFPTTTQRLPAPTQGWATCTARITRWCSLALRPLLLYLRRSQLLKRFVFQDPSLRLLRLLVRPPRAALQLRKRRTRSPRCLAVRSSPNRQHRQLRHFEWPCRSSFGYLEQYSTQRP